MDVYHWAFIFNCSTKLAWIQTAFYFISLWRVQMHFTSVSSHKINFWEDKISKKSESKMGLTGIKHRYDTAIFSIMNNMRLALSHHHKNYWINHYILVIINIVILTASSSLPARSSSSWQSSQVCSHRSFALHKIIAIVSIQNKTWANLHIHLPPVILFEMCQSLPELLQFLNSCECEELKD